MTKFIVTGRIAADIELRNTNNNKPVTDILIASPSPVNKDQADFVRVNVFGKDAENSAKFLGKGDYVIAEGFIKTDQWEDKETQKTRSAIKLTATRVEFGPKKISSEGSQQPTQRTEDIEVPF